MSEVSEQAQPPGGERGALAAPHARAQPRAAVSVRGVELYALWGPGQAPTGDPSALPKIGGEQTSVGLWTTTHLVWLPGQQRKPTPWISLAEAEAGLAALRKRLAELVSTRAGAAGGSVQPAYQIVYLRELRATPPRRVRKRLEARGRRGDGPAQWAQQEALGELLGGLGVTTTPLGTRGWGPFFFTQFDREQGVRGILAIAPALAVVAGVSQEQVRTLASLIQPLDVEITGSGIGLLRDRYEAVLGRITEWNGAQDVFEAVHRLEGLIDSGNTSTVGQLWLNFALAAIGILIAVFTGPRLGYAQLAPLVLLALASVFHARYALKGSRPFQWVGLALWVAAVVVTVALLTGGLGAAR